MSTTAVKVFFVVKATGLFTLFFPSMVGSHHRGSFLVPGTCRCAYHCSPRAWVYVWWSWFEGPGCMGVHAYGSERVRVHDVSMHMVAVALEFGVWACQAAAKLMSKMCVQWH